MHFSFVQSFPLHLLGQNGSLHYTYVGQDCTTALTQKHEHVIVYLLTFRRNFANQNFGFCFAFSSFTTLIQNDHAKQHIMFGPGSMEAELCCQETPQAAAAYPQPSLATNQNSPPHWQLLSSSLLHMCNTNNESIFYLICCALTTELYFTPSHC